MTDGNAEGTARDQQGRYCVGADRGPAVGEVPGLHGNDPRKELVAPYLPWTDILGVRDPLHVPAAHRQVSTATVTSPLPAGSQARKDVPLARGLLDYFPAALAEVARVSKAGNDKHNPGQPIHHARGKSTDHADCIVRHLMDRGATDEDDGQRHSAKVAWRALALLQEELEAEGAPLARGARLP